MQSPHPARGPRPADRTRGVSSSGGAARAAVRERFPPCPCPSRDHSSVPAAGPD